MKALLLDEPGNGLEKLRIGEAPTPQPGAGEVRVRVHAAGLNPVDYKLAANGYPAWTYPHIPGVDAAGVIDAVGQGVKSWHEGDAVFFHASMARNGTYAEYALADARALAPKPERLSFEEAAAIPCAGFTAYQALHRKARVRDGETVLITAGAGGVGGYAVQLARRAGLNVIATCSESNGEYVRALGAHHVIDYHEDIVASRVRELTAGRGVDVMIDCAGGAIPTAGLEMLAFNGHLVAVVSLPDFSRIQRFEKAPSIHVVALGGAYVSQDAAAIADLGTMGRELGRLADEGKIRTTLGETVEMEGIPEALERLAQRHTRGKIVGSINDE